MVASSCRPTAPYLRADPDAETEILATYASTGEPAIVVQRHGDGWVLLTGPHPEWEGPDTWGFIKNCVLWSMGLLDGAGEPE